LKWTRWILESWVSVMNYFGTSSAGLHIETVYFGSVRVRVYKPLVSDRTLPAVVLLHGGGYVLATIDTYESMSRRIAGTAVAHAFPAGLDDAESVVVHLLTKAYATYGVDPTRVAIWGDSAGGGIAAAVTHRLRNRTDLPKLRAQVLIYPELQIGNFRTPSYEYYRRVLNGRAFVDPRAVTLYYLMYAGIDLKRHRELINIALENRHLSSAQRAVIDKFVSVDKLPPSFRVGYNVSVPTSDEEAVRLLSPFVLNPEFCPLMQPNLRALPPALVVTCQYDVLRDEGMLYARRLVEAGVPTTWKHFPNGFHALLNFHPLMLSSSKAFDEVALWLYNNL
uniref:Arylacetamide deacetylase n=1 Tax=Toxocara canis TaxID=6265 RepID=A0A183V7A2_TOXCA